MKKTIFAVVAALGLCAVEAKAGTTPTFEVAYTTYATTGIRCSTSTAIQINASRPTGWGANVAGYRLVNQDAGDSVWIGGPSVSTDTAVQPTTNLTNLGEELKSGASSAWPVGKDYGRPAVPLAPIYCKAADAAGASGAIISIVWFGY